MAALASRQAASGEPIGIRLRIGANPAAPIIPADFLGFGYEVSEVAVPGFFSASNRKYIQFVRTIAPDGVIRIGGNTADFSSWSPDGDAVARPKGTVINRQAIEDLSGFLRATGWKLIWVLNAGTGSPEAAADQAATVAKAVGSHLVAFEIGNEPDMFVFSGHRPQGYGYQQYLGDFRRFSEAVRRSVPGASLAGPAVLASSDWTGSFAKDEAGSVKLLTQHYYINDQSSPAATLENLLQTDARLTQMTQQLHDNSVSSGIPWRIPEANSFSGGGKPGVSDTAAAAIWALDFMFSLAAAGSAGVNFETGVNHLGFVSSYSPIFQNEAGYSARPVYYAMLAFQPALGAQLGDVTYAAGHFDVKSWAFRSKSGQLWVALLNKNVGKPSSVQLESPTGIARAEIFRLVAAKQTGDALFANSKVDDSGSWTRSKGDVLLPDNRSFRIEIPPVSAAMLRLF